MDSKRFQRIFIGSTIAATIYDLFASTIYVSLAAQLVDIDAKFA